MAMLEHGELEAARDARYEGWNTPEGQAVLAGGLDTCFEKIMNNPTSPEPQSGRQERLENLVNRFI